MPIRHSLQPPIRADLFTRKSFRFTTQSAADQFTFGQLIVSTPVGNPSLIADYPGLVFPRTAFGRPRVLTLAIAQQYTSTPVKIATDAPDYFQLATDRRPRFVPAVMITPSSTGTYVHIRYAPGRTGSHRGHLLIETPYISRRIALSGSRGVLPALPMPQLPTLRMPQWPRLHRPQLPRLRVPQLPTLRTPSLPTLRIPKLPARPSPSNLFGRVSIRSWRAGLLAAGLISGLVLTGYLYRCQLVPSLCQEDIADRILPKSNPPVPTILMGKAKPKLAKRIVAPDPVESGTGQTAQATGNRVQEKPKLSQFPSGSPDTDRVVASSSATVHKPVGRRVVHRQVDAMRTNVRLPRVAVPKVNSDESDLERELNRTY